MLAARFLLSNNLRQVTLVIVVMAACSPELSDAPLAERTGPVDTTGLPTDFRSRGGPVLLHVTGWVNPDVVRRLEDAGLRPLPQYRRVERMDSLGMNIVGGTVPPEGLGSIMAVRFVVAIEPAH